MLAADLTLPKLRQRWPGTNPAPARAPLTAAERAAAVHALVVGVVFIRRVLHSTALDTMDDAEFERSVGRSIQALVDH